MKVARFYAPGDIRLEDVDEPAPGPDEVKIRVRNCSTCGTDVKILNNGHPNMTPPQVMGHEIAGEVVEVGSDVSGWSVGEGVQVIAAIPDGTCEECRRGRMTVCTNQTSMGYQYPGGFAEYMIVPRAVLAVDGLNRIPAGLSFAEASVAEPFACVLNGQELAGVGDGDDVVVVGAGPIGCLHVRLARARGAKRVFLIDLNRGRLDMSAAAVQPDAAICGAETDTIDEVKKADRRPRRGCRDHRGGRGEGAGGRPADAGPWRPAERLRRSAEGQAERHRRRQPGALPGADDRRGERLEPGAQQAGARDDRLR